MEAVTGTGGKKSYVRLSGYDPRFAALARLLKHGYFFRLWIIQEIVFGKAVNVRCGSCWIDWIQFSGMLRDSTTGQYHGGQYHGLAALNRRAGEDTRVVSGQPHSTATFVSGIIRRMGLGNKIPIKIRCNFDCRIPKY
jgi:hypothetical protein